ncbi:hypothetical protein ZOSMA_114G00280 [Zostera marina]|uniref:Uncharacterized protein n=1 Tax=Zostera marina TaxID=29655 RepID=A0A0K9Q2A0_ZOSMR|nr:hypothetical protein ZOSMA_114G00280 [Zostera marina]
MSYYRRISSSEDDIFFFSWEKRRESTSIPVLSRSNTTHSISNKEEKEFPLPLRLPPSPAFHIPKRNNYNFSKHGSWRKIDPFYAAYLKCTEDISDHDLDLEEKKTSGVYHGHGRKMGMSMRFSCKSASIWNDVIQEAMAKSPRLPKSP